MLSICNDHNLKPSPVWAVEFADTLKDPQPAAQFWQLGEIEYYDLPYFRTHYAYYLAGVALLWDGYA